MSRPTLPCIRDLLSTGCLSDAEVAEKVGVSESTVYRWRHDLTPISRAHAEAVLRAHKMHQRELARATRNAERKLDLWDRAHEPGQEREARLA